MNPDSEIYTALSRSMGHVSRQRVRYIQMELRRYATDARMKNERQFWSLLEGNGLRLPKRTADNFLSLIRDQRGINVDLATKYLKESQKKTRRDSVEALVKGDLVAAQRKNHKLGNGNKKALKKQYTMDEFHRVGRLVVNANTATKWMRRRSSSGEEKVLDDEREPCDSKDEHGVPILQYLMDNDNDRQQTTENEDPSLTTDRITDPTENRKMDYLIVPHPEPKALPVTEDPFAPLLGDNLAVKVTKNLKKSKKKKKESIITVIVEQADVHTEGTEQAGLPVQSLETTALKTPSSEKEDLPTNEAHDERKSDNHTPNESLNKEENLNGEYGYQVTGEQENEKESDVKENKSTEICESNALDVADNVIREHNTPAGDGCEVSEKEKEDDDGSTQLNDREHPDFSGSLDEISGPQIPASLEEVGESQDGQNEKNPPLQENVTSSSPTDNLSDEEQGISEPHNKTERGGNQQDDPVENASDVFDYSTTDSLITDDVSELNCSYSESITSESDISLKHATFDTTSIADFGGEDVDVGGFRVTMYPPEWYHNKEFLDVLENAASSSEPELKVEWVYGCETLNSQCMVPLDDDEIAYGSGCMIILYNYTRHTQRHYVGHSGPITCVAVHPNHTTIASSQGEVKTNNFEELQNNDGSHGRIHVRVWDVRDLVTLYIFGAGTFQGTVCKMQFMTCQNYVIVIEDNDESSLTLWHSGCKLKSISTVVNNQTSGYSTNNNKQTNDNSPRAIASSCKSSSEFVIAGKEHLGFWKITEHETLSPDSENKELVKIIGPLKGDFLKQFRPRHVTCCTSIDRYGAGYYVSGDTNGTIMIWSEQQKEVVAAANHAHECPIICVAATKAHVFSAGAADRTICAFAWGKEEMERVGSITLPNNVGKITSICQVGEKLFVATNFQMVVSVRLNHPAYLSDVIRPRTASRSSMRSSKSANPENEPDKKDDDKNVKNIFTQWDLNEIARGSKYSMKCVCVSDLIRNHARSPTPTLSEKSRRRLPKSARTRRQSAASSSFRPSHSARPYRGLSEIGRQQSSTGIGYPIRDSPNFSSPRLQTGDRCLRRQQLKLARDHHTPILLFPKENFIDKTTFENLAFPTGVDTDQEKRKSLRDSKSYVVWTADTDGWILGYDAVKHCILARFKLPKRYDVDCIDCSSARGYIALGCSDGISVLIGVSHDGFKIIAETNHWREASRQLPIKIIRFSKNGRKLAVGLGSEISLNTVKEDGLHEIDRYKSDTNSDQLFSLEWSSVRIHGSFLLRACYLNPKPKICVWSTEDSQCLQDISTLRNMIWNAPSSPLDFSVKGIWNHVDKVNDMSSLVVTDIEQRIFVEELPNSGMNDNAELDGLYESGPYTTASNNFCVVGDESGHIRVYRYPCISSTSLETVFRPFHSRLSRMSVSRNFIFAASTEDRNLLQLCIVNDRGIL